MHGALICPPFLALWPCQKRLMTCIASAPPTPRPGLTASIAVHMHMHALQGARASRRGPHPLLEVDLLQARRASIAPGWLGFPKALLVQAWITTVC